MSQGVTGTTASSKPQSLQPTAETVTLKSTPLAPAARDTIESKAPAETETTPKSEEGLCAKFKACCLWLLTPFRWLLDKIKSCFSSEPAAPSGKAPVGAEASKKLEKASVKPHEDSPVNEPDVTALIKGLGDSSTRVATLATVLEWALRDNVACEAALECETDSDEASFCDAVERALMFMTGTVVFTKPGDWNDSWHYKIDDEIPSDAEDALRSRIDSVKTLFNAIASLEEWEALPEELKPLIGPIKAALEGYSTDGSDDETSSTTSTDSDEETV